MAQRRDEPVLTRLHRPPPPHAATTCAAAEERGAEGGERGGLARILRVFAHEAVRRLGAAGMQGVPILSFDNASIHTAHTNAGHLPPGVTQRALPARSPDLHKVIEHTFGRLKPRVAAAVYNACARAGTAELMNSAVRSIVERSLREVAMADMISKDCESLKTTLQIVAHDKGELFTLDERVLEGTGGDWAPRRWR